MLNPFIEEYAVFCSMDSKILVELVKVKMPFGKYKDYLLCNLPVSYLEWMHSKGWPPGRLGQQLATIYEIKINGLEYILKPLKEGAFGLK